MTTHIDTRQAASVHLDALRFGAALVVFGAHAREMFLSPVRPLLGISTPRFSLPPHYQLTPLTLFNATSIGHQAVMLFFVLSGLLVGGSVVRSAKRGDFSWPDYLNHRLSRLWVPLIPALVLGGLMDFTTLHAFPGEDLMYPTRDLHVSTFLGNIVFLQDLFVYHLGSNSPLWSLSFEWAYYLAFPLGFFALLDMRRAPAKAAVYVILFAALAWVYSGTDVPALFVVWLMGVAVTLLPANLPAAPVKWLLPAALVVLLICDFFLLKSGIPIPASDLLLGVPVALVCYLALNARGRPHPLYARISAFGAGMSYTLYLTNYPALLLLKAWLAPAASWPFDLPHMAAFIAIVAGVFFYAWVCYWLFEARTPQVRRFFAKKLARA